jgi:uncharacterized protein RhaS with RHS repeats
MIERFLGEDPIGFASKDFNFYRYVGNGPISNIDPFGLSYLDFDVDIRNDPSKPKEPWKDDKPKKQRGSCCDWLPGIDGDESSNDIMDLEDKWVDCCNNTDVLPVCE